MNHATRRTAMAFILIGSMAVACSYLRDDGPKPYRPPGLQRTLPSAVEDRGVVLYQRDCAWCHGPSGQGTTNGPDLNGSLDGGAYTDFMLRTGRMPLAAPLIDAVRGRPAYAPADVAAIVALVEAFGGDGPEVPSPDPAAGDLARGEQLYQENCAACHSTTGVGGALTSGHVAPALDADVTPTQIAEAMAVGPGCANTSPTCGVGEGTMPRFDLPKGDVDSIVLYVASLQHPDDRGGAPIGRIGPVAEGAVGLLLGLGVLLLVARWIGTRADEDR
jgi:ubiquinol-cytochrome c reductase cytochrome c subunit